MSITTCAAEPRAIGLGAVSCAPTDATAEVTVAIFPIVEIVASVFAPRPKPPAAPMPVATNATAPAIVATVLKVLEIRTSYVTLVFMKQLIFIAALALAGCATSPSGLASTSVESSVTSTKSAKDFAICVAESLPGATLRDDGTRYWVLFDVFGVPRFRWDFIPTETGSVVEIRSTAVGGAGTKEVRRCA